MTRMCTLFARPQLARRRVRLARPEEVLCHTGFTVGTVPPFGEGAAAASLACALAGVGDTPAVHRPLNESQTPS